MRLILEVYYIKLMGFGSSNSFHVGCLRVHILILGLACCISCSSVKQLAVGRDLNRMIENSSVFKQYLFGFTLYDLETETYVNEVNSDLYFTPASNIKVLTLAACLNGKSDRIPSFLTADFDGKKVIRPLGDPTFLHPEFSDQRAWKELAKINSDTIYYDISLNTVDHYAPGWAWSDYWYDYQPQRNSLPMYGNVLTASVSPSSTQITPSFFRPYVNSNSKSNFREQNANIFHLAPKTDGDTSVVRIPFITNLELETRLLGDTLNKVVIPISINKKLPWDTVRNGNMFHALSIMMQISDNFLAEQLLINRRLTMGISSEVEFFNELQNTVFEGLTKPLIWVDGSGLSRYNMVTPRSMVEVLEKIYYQLTWEEITTIFATGGINGTIKNWYNGDEPYIFAKTGTLRHNHNLSGFIRTKSGKFLIFSMMNNHHPMRNAEVKAEMQRVLESIRDNY